MTVTVLECAEESWELSTVRPLAERVLPQDDGFVQTDGDVSGTQVQTTAACSLWQKGRVGQRSREAADQTTLQHQVAGVSGQLRGCE